MIECIYCAGSTNMCVNIHISKGEAVECVLTKNTENSKSITVCKEQKRSTHLVQMMYSTVGGIHPLRK